MSEKPVGNGPTVRPLTEGYAVKGGQNPRTSQVQTRPLAPAPIPRPSTPPAPSGLPRSTSSDTGGRSDG